MESRNNQLSAWFLHEISRGDPGCDQQLRAFIRQDKNLIRRINILFKKNEIYEMKKLITKHISDNKLIIRTCKACEAKQVIFTDDLLEGTCIACDTPLLNRTQHKKKAYETKQPSENDKKRSCIYCGQPVAPYSKMVCNSCYKTNSLTSVRFS